MSDDRDFKVTDSVPGAFQSPPYAKDLMPDFNTLPPQFIEFVEWVADRMEFEDLLHPDFDYWRLLHTNGQWVSYDSTQQLFDYWNENVMGK